QPTRAALSATRPIGQTAPIRVLASGAATSAEPGPDSPPVRSADDQEAAPSGLAWSGPRTPQARQASAAPAEPAGETPRAVTARSSLAEAAVEALPADQGGTPAAGPPETGQTANSRAGEAAATQPWSWARPSADAARDAYPRALPSRGD